MTLLHWQHSSKTNERKMHIMQIAMQKRKKISASAVGTLDFFTVLTTYRSDLCKKLHYAGGIFIQKIYSLLRFL
jgi:hypothetical protein